MATVTHYIYSHYDPKDRQKLQRATGQVVDETPEDIQEEVEEEDPWQTESSFSAQRRIASAPRFVPAVVSYDEINNMIGIPHDLFKSPQPKRGDDVAGWYRALSGSSSTTPAPTTGQTTPDVPREPIAPQPSTLISAVSPEGKARRRKNDWFISKAISSETSSASRPPTPTLADILSREPPPSEKPLTPPVFLALGPSNKGFAMLERSGWREGETLGAHVARRVRTRSSTPHLEKPVKTEAPVKQEEREVLYGEDGEVSEIRKVEVVDLTLSDPEEGDIDIPSQLSSVPSTPAAELDTEEPPSEPVGRALLTPLPTVLKSDRLGIGLKAKTVGPHKASKKRVTHGQAALTAHTRAAEETRLMKKVMGRGSRAFARQARAESEQRRQLLAHLNEP